MCSVLTNEAGLVCLIQNPLVSPDYLNIIPLPKITPEEEKRLCALHEKCKQIALSQQVIFITPKAVVVNEGTSRV